jgi:hypothetical protein
MGRHRFQAAISQLTSAGTPQAAVATCLAIAGVRLIGRHDLHA